MVTKKGWVKKGSSSKDLFYQKLEPNEFRSKKIWVQTNFASKRVLEPKDPFCIRICLQKKFSKECFNSMKSKGGAHLSPHHSNTFANSVFTGAKICI